MKNLLLIMGVSAFLATPAFAQNADGVSPTDAENSVEAKAVKVAKKKIKDRRHPDYVRCRSEAIIGSLAKKRRVCMTNRQWAEAAREGNAYARDMVEGAMSNANNGN